jgi:hypothetical protein
MFFWLIGCVSLAIAARNGWRGGNTRAWPTAPGRVLDCEMRPRSQRGGSRFRIVVAYEYDVAGMTFRGDRIRFGYAGTDSLRAAMERTARYPPGEAVEVRYNPKRPSVSVLEVGVEQTPFFVGLAIGAALFVVGVFQVF